MLLVMFPNDHFIISSVIRQKGESQNGAFKKTKYDKFSEKRTFLTNWYTHVLKFDLLPYYRRYHNKAEQIWKLASS